MELWMVALGGCVEMRMSGVWRVGVTCVRGLSCPVLIASIFCGFVHFNQVARRTLPGGRSPHPIISRRTMRAATTYHW